MPHQTPSLSQSIQRVKEKNIESRRVKMINVMDAPNPTTRCRRLRNISGESNGSRDRSKTRESRDRSEKGESRDRGKIFPPSPDEFFLKSSDETSSSEEEEDKPRSAKRKKVDEAQKIVVRVKGKDGKPKMVRITKAKHEELLLRQRRQEVLAKRIPKLSSRSEFRKDSHSPKKSPTSAKTFLKGWSSKLKSPSKKISEIQIQNFSPPRKNEKFVSSKSASEYYSSGAKSSSGEQNAFSLTQILGPEVAPPVKKIL